MKPVFLVRRGELANKPKHGEPCNQCGLCCRATICKLGRAIFQRPAFPGPCPALLDGKTCGVAMDPMRYRHALTIDHVSEDAARGAALTILGFGLGCDARFNGEKADLKLYERADQYDRDHALEIAAARALWGIKIWT